MMFKKDFINFKKVMIMTFLFAVSLCMLMSCTAGTYPHRLDSSSDYADTANIAVSNTDAINNDAPKGTSIHESEDTIDLGTNKHTPDRKHVKECKDWLVGHWFMPHSAFIYIDFNSDSTFIFMDYNIDLEASEKLTGKYSIDGNKLYLNYNDRKSQTFALVKGKSEYESYIKKGDDYYFVKSHR